MEKVAAFDITQMELDILELVHTLGNIQRGNTFVKEFLHGKYGSSDEADQQLTVLIDYLVEKRYLFPYFGSTSHQEITGMARGITPKGMNRLQELQHPIRTWVRANWFAVVVASTTATIGFVSLAIDLIVNLA